MRVLVAFDKFKDALTAPAACEHARAVLAELHPDWTVDVCPLTDGGEGFAPILTAAAGGGWHESGVSGPRGGPTVAGFGLVKPDVLPPAAQARLAVAEARSLAVIEMATASGLQALAAEDRDPWQTDSRGTGQLIRAAMSAGADAVLLGVGGSATHDLGLGALTALGWRAEQADGTPLARVCPAAWPTLARLVPGGFPLPPLRIACDVANPLLGPRGAATVFGPQKGLLPADLPRLEAETARVAQRLAEAAGRPGLATTPGAGAAGGMAFGFLTAMAAQLVPGYELVEEWLDLGARLDAADLVITGEGRFDDSSLDGKGPGALALRAAALGKRVWILAGAVTLARAPSGCEALALTPAGTPLATALAQSGANLQRGLRARLTATG